MNAQQLPTLDSGLSMDDVGDAVQPPARPETETPKVEPTERQPQPSIALSVREVDRTTLMAIIDRSASQKRILLDLKQALPQFAVPYRELEEGIVEAIRTRLKEDITFYEASIRVFGTPRHSRMIRYWRNRWELQ
jgi:hypothetical protein